MSDLPKRLRASVACGAMDGNRFERAVCGNQMREAAEAIETLQAELAAQAATIERLKQRCAKAEMEGGWAIDPKQYVPIERIAERDATIERLTARLRQYEPEPGRCEHGVLDGDWCEPCNTEYKRAATAAMLSEATEATK